jgi:3-oxoacyl-[acyl-carrier protein] reductase
LKVDLTNKVALITGASTGIGRSTALMMAQCGAKVVVHYNSSEQAAHQIVGEIEVGGGEALAVKADVTCKNEIEAMVQQVVKKFGPKIDILVNNAGGLVQRMPITEISETVIDEILNLNVKSVLLVTQAVLPFMGNGGRIINISSIAARNGGSGGAVVYAAAKGAVNTMTWGMAKELINRGILVNAVGPGVIRTPFHEKYTTPENYQALLKTIPLDRDGQPEEIASAVVFLASEYASFFVGEVLDVNGGAWMG